METEFPYATNCHESKGSVTEVSYIGYIIYLMGKGFMKIKNIPIPGHVSPIICRRQSRGNVASRLEYRAKREGRRLRRRPVDRRRLLIRCGLIFLVHCLQQGHDGHVFDQVPGIIQGFLAVLVPDYITIVFLDGSGDREPRDRSVTVDVKSKVYELSPTGIQYVVDVDCEETFVTVLDVLCATEFRTVTQGLLEVTYKHWHEVAKVLHVT